jgi:PhnB protein
MAPKVRPIPEGARSLTPSITVRSVREAITFYKKAFGATSVGDLAVMPDGSVAHAEVRIGDSVVMLSDETATGPTKSPQSLSATTFALNFYVEDVDTVFTRAIEAGAKVIFPLADQFYGDRAGRVADPFGHHWILATHIEDVTEEEMKRRMANYKP